MKFMLFIKQEILFDLFKNIDGYLEWFIPYFKENYYNKDFEYFNSKNDATTNNSISQKVKTMYHEMKPNMKEIFETNFSTRRLLRCRGPRV